MEPNTADKSAAQDISDAVSALSISDVNSGVFPAYSSRESVSSGVRSTGDKEATVEPEHGILPCYNFVRGNFVIIEFDQDGNLDYKPISLDEIPETSPGRFHCLDCSLHFEDKALLQIHLIKTGMDFNEEESAHIVCPVCFIEFIPPDRVEQLVEHIKSEHDWELQHVMNGGSLSKRHTGFDEQSVYSFNSSQCSKKNDGTDSDDAGRSTGVWLDWAKGRSTSK